ncbi:unnamed protein product [Didymodactylos carnosus]|uniref:SHSP domain-containing protein n=1 Tax=Didymodactylos carnosus TaxID=1234261 RepID=A0A814JPF8_9BILA|nr:unnamed protein product [Didymodactylos carnosus]CAF1040455.1 unnamed protein product [Didymodactylos carnosus]CAF3594877.1 unnamed protein product [Didymodactylos carnosus]CAF3810646.1 unnamed protein product [Didymodactylos carnosus]
MSERNFQSRSYESRSGGNSSSIYDHPPLDINREVRTNIPIQHTQSSPHLINVQHTQPPPRLINPQQKILDRVRHPDTNVQWINEPVRDAFGNILSTNDKFRITVNVDGFRQNEINVQTTGNKVTVTGEHIENRDEGVAKKRIEKSFELPRDVDPYSSRVTYPSPTTMYIDFSTRQYSAIGGDNGRHLTNFSDSSPYHHHREPKFTQEKHSSEYSSTKKIGGTGIGEASSYYRDRSLSPNVSHYHREPFNDTSSRNYGASSSGSSHYRVNTDNRPHSGSPARGIFVNSLSKYDNLQGPYNPSNVTWSDSRQDNYNRSSPYVSSIAPRITTKIRDGSRSPSYTINVSASNPRQNVETFSETKRERHVERSSPTTGTTASHEYEHQRSGSPSTRQYHSNITPSLSIDDDNLSHRFKTGVNLDRYSTTSTSTPYYEPPSLRNNNDHSSRNVEVHEYSRRLAGNEPISTTRLINNDGFNAEAFYKSAFQPKIFYNQHGQQQIEMKLDAQNYEPNEIKVSMNGYELIVQAEHSNRRPPNQSSRSYFHKQITLPPDTDLSTITSRYEPDQKLYITALLKGDKFGSIKYK